MMNDYILELGMISEVFSWIVMLMYSRCES
jgi:hypothetical protein